MKTCLVSITIVALFNVSHSKFDDLVTIDIIDLAQPTSFNDMAEYYSAVEKNWKICISCGVPGLGTAMHLEQESSTNNAMYPAVVPTEYLVTRLQIVDVTRLVKENPELVLTPELALQWRALKIDPREPTLLLFKFGWSGRATRNCVCRIPGISFELAEYIAANLTRVVAVATDAPTLESEQTREFNSKTVASILGRSGIYMIENVKIKRKLPETGCMAIAMPLKMEHKNYVPSRLTAYCPSQDSGGHQVVLSVRKSPKFTDLPTLYPRKTDVDMEDLM